MNDASSQQRRPRTAKAVRRPRGRPRTRRGSRLVRCDSRVHGLAEQLRPLVQQAYDRIYDRDGQPPRPVAAVDVLAFALRVAVDTLGPGRAVEVRGPQVPLHEYYRPYLHRAEQAFFDFREVEAIERG